MLRLLVICALFGLVCRADDDVGPVFGSPERREETALMKTLLKRLLENKKTAREPVCPEVKPFCVMSSCFFAIDTLDKPMYASVDYHPTQGPLVIEVEVSGTPYWEVIFDETYDDFEPSMLPYTTKDTFGFDGKTYKVYIGSIDPSGDDMKGFCLVEV